MQISNPQRQCCGFFRFQRFLAVFRELIAQRLLSLSGRLNWGVARNF
jgi:hypothetical protein